MTPIWSDDAALRGVAGVHARRMPRYWWAAQWYRDDNTEGARRGADPRPLVTGVVERYGRYVLGSTGWRAEWVVIRELLAPDTDIAAQLRRVYPDVIVHTETDYANR